MRFLTHDGPQTSKMASTSPAAQISSSQPGLSALDHWNPSAILGRDGSTLVFKDTKTPAPRKSTGPDHASMDCLSLNMKLVLINNQSGSNRWVFLSVSLKEVLRYLIKWLAMSGRIFSYIGKLSVSRYSIFTRFIEIIDRNCINRKNISSQNVKKHLDILYTAHPGVLCLVLSDRLMLFSSDLG